MQNDKKMKIIITRREGKILTTFWNGTRVVEFRLEEETPDLQVGDIYLGIIKNHVKNIQAAFVEVQPGSLCYLPLPAGKKMAVGTQLPVQIQKEAVKSKAPVATTAISLGGRYLVLVTDRVKVAVSSKIYNGRRREELKSLLEETAADEEVGFIVRTNAEHASDEIILQEAGTLIRQYRNLMTAADHRTIFSRLYSGQPAWLTAVRDVREGSVEEIVTDQEDIREQLLMADLPFGPEQIRLYQDPMISLANIYRIEHYLESALSRRVWLRSGGYLVIDYTEAMTVIDVNTGKYDGHKAKEETFRLTNREAAVEIAAQLRLRNISGIVLIDFIDMESAESRQELAELFRQELRKDPIQAVLVDFTKLNLAEVTRKKIRKSLWEQVKGSASGHGAEL